MSKAFQPKGVRAFGFLQVSNIRLVGRTAPDEWGKITMFENFRYRMGKNMALYVLGKMRGYTPERIEFMRRISGNKINRTYGADALRHGFVANKYVAAAAVFARLANAAGEYSANEIKSEHWTQAGLVALKLAKCRPEAIEYTFEKLVEATA